MLNQDIYCFSQFPYCTLHFAMNNLEIRFYNKINSVSAEGCQLMSGKRITFRQRVILQDHIESTSYSIVTELAKLLKISRKSFYVELKNHRASQESKQ